MKTTDWSTRRVSGQVDRSECAVKNSWKQWTREGTRAENQVWKTTSRRIGRQALDPTVTCSTIRADEAIVPQTISSHLAEANLKGSRKGPFLNGLPLIWGTLTQFSSKIMLVRIQQELLKTSYVIFQTLPWCSPHTVHHTARTAPVMHGTLTGQRYVDDILRPQAAPLSRFVSCSPL
ncbi:transposable element Tcb2 transposase [Trichonephila clavipes]|nr:transposable element Tcb2 transposase [Trichonephila clavipes]